MSKATMRDVAKLAGVSVATVSYVLNKNDKISIPEETRKRVIDASEELNYVFDLNARALTRKKSGLIGIFIMSNEKEPLPWRKCFYSEFIRDMVKMLYAFNYHVLVEYLDSYSDKLDIIYERALDGVFILNSTEKYIYDITSVFKVPIILIDSYVEDTIFHKVLPDYALAVNEAKRLLREDNPFIIADSINNKVLIERLCNSNELESNSIYVVENIDGLKNFLRLNSTRKGIIFNEFLALLSFGHVDFNNIAVICPSGNEYLLHFCNHKIDFDNKAKASTAVNIMLDYINKDYHKNKFTYIKPKVQLTYP